MIDLTEAASVFAAARRSGLIVGPTVKRKHRDRREYFKAYNRQHYKPTGNRPGRPSESGLSYKQLGSSAYFKALYRLRK